jgi:riboflavin kinase/FMN adenylyltransferase
MQLIRNFLSSNLVINKQVITIGNFDGVHLGHQQLINTTVNIAKQESLIPTIMSFEPHPNLYFNRQLNNFRIISFSDKFQKIKDLGIKKFYIAKFDNGFSNLAPEDFINHILNKLNIKHIVIGYDFIFGKNREGNINVLKNLAEKYNFKITQISCLKESDTVLSSSNIRKFIKEGNVEAASKMLGYQYFISGKVISGNKTAVKLGYPTANLKLHDLQRLKYGVYLIKIFIENENKYYLGMANIGIRPTLDGLNELLEVHLFDFNKNIYGTKLKVEFIEFIREELKFPNFEALKKQIALDEIVIRNKIYEKCLV